MLGLFVSYFLQGFSGDIGLEFQNLRGRAAAPRLVADKHKRQGKKGEAQF